MGKGTNTTNTSSSTSASPQATALYQQILQQAQGVAATPYQAYSGELTAPVNSQQQTGIAGINANANYASPFVTQAAGLATGASNPLTQSQIQSYLNPYTQNVVDTTNAQMLHDQGTQMAQLQGNQIAQGALGGNATGVAKGILAANNSRNMAATDAGLYSTGYQGALNTAYQQYQQNPLAAAGSLANFGIAGQNAALTGANAQLGAGTLEQQTQQAQDTANYNAYAQAQAYPFQTTQWLAGLATGVAPGLGSSSTGYSTAPAPNQTAQYLGAGVAGAGLLLSDRRAKEDIHKIGKTNDGQPIYRYRYKGSPHWQIGLIAQEVEKDHPQAVHGIAGTKFIDLKEATDDAVSRASGGGVSAMPWGGAPTWIPTIGLGSAAPHAASAPSGVANTTSPNIDWTKLANTKMSPNGLLSGPSYGGGNVFTDAYGGSSSDPLDGLSPEDYGKGFADGGPVMSDVDPVGVSAGQQLAQSSPYQIRPNQDGTHSVINIRTGQIHFTGTPSGALNAQASLNYRNRARGGGVAGFAGGGAPDRIYRFDEETPVDEGGPLMPDASFEDRVAPVRGAVASGDFDPRGANYTPFEGTPGMVAANNGVVPMPQARPAGAGAPVVADDDDEDDTPTGVAGRTSGAPATSQPTVMAFAPSGPSSYASAPDAVTRPGGLGIGLGLISPNAQTGLLATGLGMLASRSPFLGNAIGEGGIAGLSAYGAAQTHDEKVAADAAKLSKEAQQHAEEMALKQGTLGETIRHNKETEANNAETKIPSGYQKNRDGTLSFIPGGPHDPDQIGAETKARTKNGAVLDDDTVDSIAQRVAQGDTRAVIGLGRNPAAIMQIQRRVAQIFHEQGLDNEEGAKSILGNIADQAGRMTAERTQAGIASKLAVYGRNVDNAISVATKASEDVGRTGFVPVNKALNAARTQTGDPKTVALGQALYTLINEYARAIGGGHGTVHDKEEAEQKLNQAYTHEQLVSIMGVMRQEVEMTKKSLPEARQEMRDLYARPPAGGAVRPPSAPPASTGTFTPPSGAIPRQYNGKTYYYDPVSKQPYPGQ